MLQKNKSQRISLIKYGLSAPLFILMLILSSATINNSKPITVINSRAHQLFLTPARPAALGDAFSEVKKTTIVKLKPVAPEVKETAVADIADTIKKIYTSVEQVPEFPGGLNALGRFVGTNIRYPKAEREKGIQGRVIATFVVETDGSLSNLEITRSISKGLDDESLRVLRLSPNWKPGVQNGENVRVQYSIPISFTLADSKEIKPGTDKKTNVESVNKDENTFTTADSSQGKSKMKISFRDSKSDPATQPLYIVDGKSMDQFNIKNINANSIQSINVLKGEAATAIYGAKAINGVVLITSKSTAKTAEPVKGS